MGQPKPNSRIFQIFWICCRFCRNFCNRKVVGVSCDIHSYRNCPGNSKIHNRQGETLCHNIKWFFFWLDWTFPAPSKKVYWIYFLNSDFRHLIDLFPGPGKTRSSCCVHYCLISLSNRSCVSPFVLCKIVTSWTVFDVRNMIFTLNMRYMHYM